MQILFDVRFEVHQGEMLALLGTNGAGKSTLLKAISGLGTPSAASCASTVGRSPTSRPSSARLGIVLLPGRQGRVPEPHRRREPPVGAYLYRGDRADVDRRIADVLELFPSSPSAQDQLAGDLSGGQQQMLALAPALLHEPELLLIDELSLGLAPIVVQQLLEVVERAARREGMTIVIVEQSLNVALAVADRAVFLEKGECASRGPRAGRARRPRASRVPRRRGLSVLARVVTPQVVFNGVVNGLLIGLLAMAMVLVYRSTRVVNFAVGNIGLVDASPSARDHVRVPVGRLCCLSGVRHPVRAISS